MRKLNDAQSHLPESDRLSDRPIVACKPRGSTSGHRAAATNPSRPAAAHSCCAICGARGASSWLGAAAHPQARGCRLGWSAVLRDHPTLVVFDPGEERHGVVRGAVHAHVLEVLRDPLGGDPRPLRQPSSEHDRVLTVIGIGRSFAVLGLGQVGERLKPGKCVLGQASEPAMTEAQRVYRPRKVAGGRRRVVTVRRRASAPTSPISSSGSGVSCDSRMSTGRCIVTPANGSPSVRKASGPTSRNAFAVTRWPRGARLDRVP